MFGLKIPRPTGQGLRTLGLLLGAPVFGGLLAWQLYELTPGRACDLGFIAAQKSAEVSYLQAFNGCLNIYGKIIDVRDHAILMLGTIVGLGYMMMMMREFRMQGEIKGPGGIGGSFRSDPDADHDKPPETPADGAAMAENAVASVVDGLRDNEERG